MSARPRAAPWFRDPPPMPDPLAQLGVEVSRVPETMAWEAPLSWRQVSWHWEPGDRERLADRGIYLDESAFVAATHARLDIRDEHRRWWDEAIGCA